MWNAIDHTDEENHRWCLLRSIEWKALPAFASQPVVPFLIQLYPWYYVIAAIIIADLIWSALFQSFVSVRVAFCMASLMFFVKWPILLCAAVVFLAREEYSKAAFAMSWPIIAGIIGPISFGSRGLIQTRFMTKLGYTWMESLQMWVRAQGSDD